MCEKQQKFKQIHQFDEDEKVVSMIEFKGRIIIATEKGVYRVSEDLEQVEKLELVEDEPNG